MFNPPTARTGVASYRANIRFVDYSYDFSAVPGGLEGVLKLHLVANEGGRFINSIAGTEDFQTVQIKAQAIAPTVVSGIYYFAHEGIVHGWPE